MNIATTNTNVFMPFAAAGEKLHNALDTVARLRTIADQTSSLPSSDDNSLQSAIDAAKGAADIVAADVARYSGSKAAVSPSLSVDLARAGARQLEIARFDQYVSNSPANHRIDLLRDFDLATSMLTEAARRIGQ